MQHDSFKIGIEYYNLQGKRELFIFTYKYSLYIIFSPFLCPSVTPFCNISKSLGLVLQLSEFIEEISKKKKTESIKYIHTHCYIKGSDLCI